MPKNVGLKMEAGAQNLLPLLAPPTTAGGPVMVRDYRGLPDADVVLFSGCFGAEESARILDRLLAEIHWQQDYLTFYGKEIALPRLTAWYGDCGRNYTYSHISMKPHPWTELLLMIKARVEAVSGTEYNSVLLNLYRSGSDGVSWHQA